MTESPKTPPRNVTPRKWKTLTTAGAAIGIAVASAAHSAGSTIVAANGPEQLWLAQATGSEGGEGGEGGEAGHQIGDAEDAATIDLLMDITMLEGYLRAGVALYDMGKTEQAAIHIKAPGDDIYDELSEHFEDLGNPGFGPQLTALSQAIAAGKPAADIDAAFKTVEAAINDLRAVLSVSDHEKAGAILAVVRRASDEYQDGVDNGTVNDKVEYADAWGFVQAARAMAEPMQNSDDLAAKKFGKAAIAAIDELKPLVPGVAATGPFPMDTALFPSVAAKIELAAYGLS